MDEISLEEGVMSLPIEEQQYHFGGRNQKRNPLSMTAATTFGMPKISMDHTPVSGGISLLPASVSGNTAQILHE